jgi:hypothetical protein
LSLERSVRAQPAKGEVQVSLTEQKNGKEGNEPSTAMSVKRDVGYASVWERWGGRGWKEAEKLTLSRGEENEGEEEAGEHVDIGFLLRTKRVNGMNGTNEGRKRGRTTSIIAWTLLPNHQNISPTIVWIGTIQLFRRPSLGEKIESTTGDQRSFRE